MAHQFTAGALRGVPAWHGLGEVFDQDANLDVSGAMELGGVNFDIITVPLMAELPGDAMKPEGTLLLIPDKQVIIRGPMRDDPNPKTMGIVGKNFKPISPMRLGEILNPLSKVWPVETVFALRGGKRIGITLRMDAGDLNGDPNEKHEFYFFVAGDYEGKAALFTMVTAVRVVCQNTWNSAFGSSGQMTKFPHTGDPEFMLEFKAEMELAAIQAKGAAVSQFEAMMKQAVSDNAAKRIIEAGWPIPQKPPALVMIESPQAQNVNGELKSRMKERTDKTRYNWETSVSRAKDNWVDAYDCYTKFNNAHPKYARTVYAAMNAVNEWADWGKGKGNRQESVLFGERAFAKRRAQKVAVGMLKGGNDD